MWKRATLVGSVFAVALLVQPSFGGDAGYSKKELFGFELQACQQAFAEGTPGACEVYGKIKVVDDFPDVKVKKTDVGADLKAKWVDNFADEPGKWERVDDFPDYKVEFVDIGEDFTVEMVDDFPGCNK